MTPPDANPVLLAFACAVLLSLFARALASFPRKHRYRSTACVHDRHERCRETCKFCDAPCLCPCHRAVSVAEPGKTPT